MFWSCSLHPNWLRRSMIGIARTHRTGATTDVDLGCQRAELLTNHLDIRWSADAYACARLVCSCARALYIIISTHSECDVGVCSHYDIRFAWWRSRKQRLPSTRIYSSQQMHAIIQQYLCCSNKHDCDQKCRIKHTFHFCRLKLKIRIENE